MIDRINYQSVNRYLEWLKLEYGRDDKTTSRYFFYLRHLLFWADDRKFVTLEKDIDKFPYYIMRQPGRNGSGTLSPETCRKIIDTSKRFLLWMVDEHPVLFKLEKE